MTKNVKRVLTLLSCLLMLFALIVPGFAADSGSDLSDTSFNFSKEEMDFISSSGEVSVALIAYNKPYSYTDEDGHIVGVVPDLLETVTELCGLRFRYELIPSDYTPIQYLEENPDCLLIDVAANNEAFSRADIIKSDVYFKIYSALYTNKKIADTIDLRHGEHTIGTDVSFQTMQQFIEKQYPNLKIVTFNTPEEGLIALQNNSIELFAYLNAFVSPYLSNPLYDNIEVLDNRFMLMPRCAVASDTERNQMLIDIFNDCLDAIPSEDIIQFELDHTLLNSYQYKSSDVITRYHSVIAISGIGVASVISLLLLILFLRQRKLNREITSHAEYDLLTGLYNRSTMRKTNDELLLKNAGRGCAMLLIDIDKLILINDTKGHNFGNKLIKFVASALRNHFGGSSLVGRVGGDVFCVFLPGLESKSILIAHIRKLQQTIDTLALQELGMKFTISIGVVMGTAGELDAGEFFSRAETALHSVKHSGGDGVAFYNTDKITAYKAVHETDSVKAQPEPALVSEKIIIEGSHNTSDSDFRKLLDAEPNLAVYVISEKTHQLLYFNKHFKDICPNARLGVRCHELHFAPCDNCIVETMGERKMAQSSFHSEHYGYDVDVTATKLMWQETIPAIMLGAWPRSTHEEDDNRLSSITSQNNFDYLTGGFTRSGFINSLERMRESGIDLTNFAVLFINILDFKAVNELLGSDGGDNLLCTIYDRLEQSKLQPVVSSRKESDHFVFLVDKSALDLSLLPSLLNFHWQYGDNDLFVIARCGIFMIEDNSLPIFKMVDRAKLAKEHIVDEYVKPYEVFASSMLNDYSEQAEAFMLFDKGIKNNEFVVYYQPVMDARSGKIAGAESLVRRRASNGTIVPPGKFVPMLERTGYVTQLDRYVYGAVASFQSRHLESSRPTVPISFNLSQKDFYDEEFMEELASQLENRDSLKRMISIEITESAYTLSEEKHAILLKRFRDAGAKILLDDFGTGYSSFGMFENYNFDRVKLDMSFVRQLTHNDNIRQVVESIISMCHKLGLTVVAEGVESEAELIILQGMNCDFIQGYYFSKPLDEESFECFISAHI